MAWLGRSLVALSALLLLLLAAPVLLVKRGWRRGLVERLGWFPLGESGLAPGAIWVHGASVGESMVSIRVAEELLRADCEVLFTANTLTGRGVLQRKVPSRSSGLAPLDHPWAVARFFRRTRPSALVMVETEIWPARIAEAHRRGLPVVIVSGRISDRSFPRYMKIRHLLAPSLSRITAVGARSELDAERFRALGVPAERVRVTGDLKLTPPPAPAPLAPALAALFDQAQVPLWVAGSTHEGEETLALRALDAIETAGGSAALVIAPRHPERFEDVAAELTRSGRYILRRSRLEGVSATWAPGKVLLLDSVGELSAVYGRATLSFVGGSVVPRGGHNVLEPVFEGSPVMFGPHVDTARDAAALVCAIGAGEEVADGGALVARVVAAFAEPAATRERGERGRETLANHRGSAARGAALVLERMGRVREEGA